jgi:DNA-binding response OmpR family regulator
VSDRRNAIKILVADDDADLLDVTTYALRREGYSTVTATDGPQAVDKYAAERPDLVLLDLGLPRMSGFDVCRRIRETAATPIIMLTARSDDDNVVQGFLTGADDYVTKPFSHRQLAARIRAVLNRTHGGLTPEPAGSLTVGSLRLEMQSHDVTVRNERTVRLTPLPLHARHQRGPGRLVEPAGRVRLGLRDRRGHAGQDPHLARAAEARPGQEPPCRGAARRRAHPHDPVDRLLPFAGSGRVDAIVAAGA